MITDKEIEWREPPRLERNWQALLEPLKERPSEWAVVATYPSGESARSTAYRLRSGLLKTPSGFFEFASSGNDVHARYLGESDGDAGKVKGALQHAPRGFGFCTNSLPHRCAA